MEKQQKITIGQSNIVSLRFPKIKIKDIKKLGRCYENTLHKAILGKKLTDNQSQQLLWIHLIAEDFPILPKIIVLQLIDRYEEKLTDMVEHEYYENASEVRDIIISLRSSIA